MAYTAKTFALNPMNGISARQVEVHIKLYEGYVKHVNLIRDTLEKLKTADTPAYVRDELRRRYAFEWNGARLHEYYFEQFEGAPAPIDPESTLGAALARSFGSTDAFKAHVLEVAATRGIGWIIATFDPREEHVQVSWVSDHEIGQLAGAHIIFALDMWEHAFMVDYVPADKMRYVEAVFANLNGTILSQRFSAANGNAPSVAPTSIM